MLFQDLVGSLLIYPKSDLFLGNPSTPINVGVLTKFGLGKHTNSTRVTPGRLRSRMIVKLRSEHPTS